MKKRSLKYLSIRTITGKFFILTTTLTVIPILVVNLVFYPIVMNILRKNADNQVTESLSVGNDFLDHQIHDLTDLSNVILGNDEIQSILSTGSFDPYTYLQNCRNIPKLMTDITTSKSYIVSYFIYDAVGDPEMRTFNSGFPINLGWTTKTDSFFHYIASHGSMIWLDYNPFDEGPTDHTGPYLYVFKLLRSTSGDDQNLGYVALQIDKSLFFNGLNFLKTDFSSQYYIFNSNGNVFYHLPEQAPTIYSHLPKTSQINYKGVSYLNHQGNTNSIGWKLVHLVETPKLYKNAEFVRVLAFFLYVLMAISGWIFSHWLGKSIQKPLYQMQNYMKMSLQQKKSFASFDTRDEVGLLGDRFVRMFDENKELNRQVVDAEIKALQAQINPHFLYNTLESLNWMAISRKQFEISEVLGALGKFFRITISKGRDMIPVGEEIEHVNSYTQVQQFRYHGKFDFIVEVDSSIEKYYIPKFLLQPLVENAIYHGLKPKEGSGTIYVTGEMVGDTLVFRVTDDGVGISPECLKEIEFCMKSPIPSKVYGIKNVNDRLLLQFGEPYGLRIKSEEGLYTTSEITLPIVYEQGGVTSLENYDR